MKVNCSLDLSDAEVTAFCTIGIAPHARDRPISKTGGGSERPEQSDLVVTLGWLRLSRFAAPVKLPSIATARNARACASVINFSNAFTEFFSFA